MDKKKITPLILLDLLIVFNGIDHDRLLHNISAMGASLDALKRFKSYFLGRSQAVCIGSILSDVLPISHGVLQGAILSPLLFRIY